VNDIVYHLLSLFPYFSESVCFKISYLKNLDFHTRYDLFPQHFSTFVLKGHSGYGHCWTEIFKIHLEHIKKVLS